MRLVVFLINVQHFDSAYQGHISCHFVMPACTAALNASSGGTAVVIVVEGRRNTQGLRMVAPFLAFKYHEINRKS